MNSPLNSLRNSNLTIPGLSACLLALYIFGELSPGLSFLTGQVALIGMLASVGFRHSARAVSQPIFRPATAVQADEPAVVRRFVPSWHVEQRLTKHTQSRPAPHCLKAADKSLRLKSPRISQR